jgi:poly(3-hydroxybutyrate) depolymerase
MISRRALVSGAATSLFVHPARAGVDPGWRPSELDVREVFVQGSVSRRFVLGVPRHLGPADRVPLLVLLHGLGETGDERMGAWAWFERYGLGTSYDRLRASPSFRGLVLACPYMPNLPAGDPSAVDSYARWVALTVVARARKEAPAIDTMRATYLAGCSLGGSFSLEVLLRQPETFNAWGGVQTAMGPGAAARYAERLSATMARVGPRDLLIETSRGDPFRAGNEALARALTSAAIPHTFVELPGPHDQPWLRQRGTAAMLEWFANLPAA